MNEAPGCSKTQDVCHHLQSQACMLQFKERVEEHLLRMKSTEAQDLIETKAKTNISPKVNQNFENMKETTKDKLITKFSETALFDKTRDQPCQTVEEDDLSCRPSDEFLLTSRADEIIRLDISNTHNWEVRPQDENKLFHAYRP